MFFFHVVPFVVFTVISFRFIFQKKKHIFKRNIVINLGNKCMHIILDVRERKYGGKWLWFEPWTPVKRATAQLKLVFTFEKNSTFFFFMFTAIGRPGKIFFSSHRLLPLLFPLSFAVTIRVFYLLCSGDAVIKFRLSFSLVVRSCSATCLGASSFVFPTVKSNCRNFLHNCISVEFIFSFICLSIVSPSHSYSACL